MEIKFKKKINYVNFLRCFAIFMAALIISLPFYTSSVFAQNFVVKKVSGQKGIDGFRARNDRLNVEVEVLDEGIFPYFLEILEDTTRSVSGSRFSTCRANPSTGGSPYLCTYKSAEDEKRGGTVKYCITLDKQKLFPAKCTDANPSKTKSTEVNVDVAGPVVESFTLNPAYTKGGNVTLKYKVKDSLSVDIDNKCSGIDKIDLYDGVLKETFEVNSSDCTYEGQATFSTSAFANGKTILCIVPYDRIGNYYDEYLIDNKAVQDIDSNNCAEFGLDNSIPTLNSVNFEYKNQDKEVSYLRSSISYSVSLVADVTTSTHPIDKIVVDLSQFGASNKFTMSTSDCTAVNLTTNYICKKDVNIKMGPSSSQQVSVLVVDKAGNNISTVESFSFDIDDEKPLVSNIVVLNHMFGTESRLGKLNNTVVALISEQGSGIDTSSVTFSPLGKPDNCTLAGMFGEGEAILGDMWLCYKKNFNTQQPSITLRISGKDFAGNTFSTPSGFLIESDTKPPVVKQVKIATDESVLRTTSVATVIATFEEDFAMADNEGISNAVAKFSFAPDEMLEADLCMPIFEEGKNSTNIWECQWALNGLINNVNKDIEIDFKTVKDLVGNQHAAQNSVVKEFILEVNGKQVSKGPLKVYGDNFDIEAMWELKDYSSSPEIIDAKSAEVSTYSIWHTLDLQTGSNLQDKIEIAGVEFKGCTGDDVDNYVDLDLSNIFLVDLQKPILQITFQRGGFDAGQKNISMTCTIGIVSKGKGAYRNRVTSEQLLVFNISTPLGNVADISDAVWDDIRDRMKSDLVADPTGLISGLMKTFKWLTAFCGFVGIIQAICSGTIKTLGLASEVLEDVGITESIGEALRNFGEILVKINWWLKYLITDTICVAVSCEGTPWMGEAFQKWNNILREYGIPASLIPTSPSDSMVLSIVTFCIPGIILNLQKMREIECDYLSCLYNKVPEGYPQFYCKSTYNYKMCMLVWGELFQLIPGAFVLRTLLGAIKKFMQNPLTIFFTGISLICKLWAPSAKGSLLIACNVYDLLQSAIQVSYQIKQAIEYWGKIDVKDTCEDIIEDIKDDPRYEGKEIPLLEEEDKGQQEEIPGAENE